MLFMSFFLNLPLLRIKLRILWISSLRFLRLIWPEFHDSGSLSSVYSSVCSSFKRSIKKTLLKANSKSAIDRWKRVWFSFLSLIREWNLHKQQVYNGDFFLLCSLFWFFCCLKFELFLAEPPLSDLEISPSIFSRKELSYFSLKKSTLVS